MAKHKRSTPPAQPAPTILDAHAAGDHQYNADTACSLCLQDAEDAAILASLDTDPVAAQVASVRIQQEALAEATRLGRAAAAALLASQEAPVAEDGQDTAPTAEAAPEAASSQDAPATAPVARPALVAVQASTYPRYPTAEEAPTCGTCGTLISSLRPVATADGILHHRLCVTAPASGWTPVGWPRADAPAGTNLPPGAPAGAPVCWGCKVSWKAASRAVVATDGMPYHRLCAEWAHVLPAATPRAASVPRQPAAPRVQDSGALVADLTVRFAGQPDALASALAALVAAGVLPAAPVATPPAEAAPEAPDGQEDAPAA